MTLHESAVDEPRRKRCVFLTWVGGSSDESLSQASGGLQLAWSKDLDEGFKAVTMCTFRAY
jgi:hypothetical protein